jgi:hypothetical protein
MAGPHATARGRPGSHDRPQGLAIHSEGGKVGGLQADPAKQQAGDPCKYGRAQSIKWYAAGTQCICAWHATRQSAGRGSARRSRGKQSITHMFAAAAAKKQKKQ